MNSDDNFRGSNNNSPVRHSKILIATGLILVLILLVITIGYNSNQKNIDIAIEKVSNLFVSTNEENVLEGVPGILKDLPDHKGFMKLDMQ